MNTLLNMLRETSAMRKIATLLKCAARFQAVNEQFRRTDDLEALVTFCLSMPVAALQVPEELLEFSRLVYQQRPARILEIGTF